MPTGSFGLKKRDGRNREYGRHECRDDHPEHPSNTLRMKFSTGPQGSHIIIILILFFGSIASKNFDNLCHLVSLSASQSSCFEDTNCCINQCPSFCFMLVNHHWFPSLGAIKTISNQNNCDLIRQIHYYLYWHNPNGYLKDSYILMS